MRICLVKLSAIGDIVMTLPTVKTILKEIPKAELTWVIGKDVYSLVRDVADVNFIPVSKAKNLSDAMRNRHLFDGMQFDVLLAMHSSMSAHLFYPWIKAKRKIGFDRKRSRDLHGLFVNERISYKREHAVDMYLRFLEKLGVRKFHRDSKIPLKREEYEKAEELIPKEPFFALNPFSKKLPCVWEYDKYVEAAKRIQEQYGLKTVITGGPGETAYCEKMAKEIEGSISLCGKTTLREMAAVLEKAEFLISPDTGPAHIASAMGTPVIALFALTRPEITGPYGSLDTVVNKFDDAIQKFNPSMYEKRDQIMRNHIEGAMKLIEVGDVMAQAEKVMSASDRAESQNLCGAPSA